MKLHLNRKARTAVIVATAMLVAVPLFVVGKLATGDKSGPVGQPFEPSRDQLVTLRNGSTMLVRHDTASRITDWLKLPAKGEKRFEVGNANFAAGSATLTQSGWEHLVQFAEILKAQHGVRAVILFSPRHGDPATARLEQMRAERIRDEVLKQGVSELQIAVAPEAFEPGHDAAKDEGLEVVLTNRG